MNSGTRVGQAPNEKKSDGGPWFATFTFLDAGCAISASQFQRLLALVTNLWRQAKGEL
jgi:hypothetical protein